MRVSSSLALFALALTGAPIGAPAGQSEGQLETLIGRRVTAVRLVAEGRPVSAPDVLALVETRAGDALSMAEVRESVFHLASVGQFSQVEVDATADGDGVALAYRLVATRRVTRVDFRGDVGLSRRRLREALGTRVLGVPTADRLREAERILAALYESLGYFSARIVSAIDDGSGPAASHLVFTIDAGPRARVGRIDVITSGVARPEVLARLDLEPGNSWDAPALDRRRQRFVETLRTQGYFEAAVDWELEISPGRDVVDVTIRADAGPLVELVFDSTDVPAERLREFVPVAREGSVDEDLLEDSKRRIEQWLRAQGYARAVADYARTDTGDRLRITFRVTRGPLFEVERVEIDGVATAREAEVRSLVRLQPGSAYTEDALAFSAATIAEFYRVRGFSRVTVETSVDGTAGQPNAAGVQPVRPRIVVAEGERTTVGRILFHGASSVEEADLRARMVLAPGAPYFAQQLLADRNAVVAHYQNLGYRRVRVDVVPQPSETPGALDLSFDVSEGPQFLVGHVLVAGNTRTSVATITRELGLTPGMPLGADALANAQARLSALGLFRRVRVEDLPWRGQRVRDIAVTVEEAPATNIGYGVGLEGGRILVRDPDRADVAVEQFEISPRGFFEVGRRNLWGKNRSVNLFTRFSFRDRGGSEVDDVTDDSKFYEYRVVGTYREPRVFGSEADAQVNGFLEQGARSSFNFARQGINAEIARTLRPTFTLVGRYTFGKTRLFDERLVPEEKPIVDRLFPQVRLSVLSGVLVHDSRDDPLDPTTGYVANMQGDLSSTGLGSEVGYVKSFVQGFFYRRLPGANRLVLAGGARLGLATAFSSTSVEIGETGQPVEVPVKDLPASERFYAGGSTTVRGYALDRLGDDATIDSDGFPQGGNALIIFNGELRFPVWRSLGGVVFIDSGNVFARVEDFDLGRIKASVGAGARYRSPIGPIRVDIGLKLDPRTFANGQRERGWEVHVSLGQAF